MHYFVATLASSEMLFQYSGSNWNSTFLIFWNSLAWFGWLKGRQPQSVANVTQPAAQMSAGLPDLNSHTQNEINDFGKRGGLRG
jgi:hypothetical protein